MPNMGKDFGANRARDIQRQRDQNKSTGSKGPSDLERAKKGATDEKAMAAQQAETENKKSGDDSNGGTKQGSGSFTSGTDNQGSQHVRSDQTPRNGGVGTGADGSGTEQRQKAWKDAVDDYNDVNNTGWDDFWNGVADFLGLREQNPSMSDETDPNKGPLATGNADWGLDTAGIAGGLVGGALFPGAGLITGPLASALNDEFGNPIPDVNLGQLGSEPTPGSTAGQAKANGDVAGGSTDTADSTNGDATGGDTPDRTGAADVSDNISDPTGTDQPAPDVKPSKPATPQDSTDTILPQVGIGISIPTQTSGAGSSVYVGTPEQRRRRGALGGLGRGGLAL